jgi:GTP-binding protein
MLLLDARIEVKASDTAAMELLDRAAVTYQFVLTKADDVKPAALAAKKAELLAIAAKHGAAHPEIAVTSSNSGFGIEHLRGSIAALAD